MVTVKVNGREIEVNKSLTILQACYEAGVEVPRFCYHEKLSIAGNCRMCLVEIRSPDPKRPLPPKPVASCAMGLTPGLEIYTETPMVTKARAGVMEMLLANHPLDCPICDQGGECDLQDQAMAFGKDRGRFYEQKRAVEDKDCGPLVKTIMTRCIHCTRCVRFTEEVAGMRTLGTTGRGNHMEIGTYVEKSLESEVSGNIIDLCPVGALTSKPYAFTARSWELRNIEGLDISDGLGSNMNVCIRGEEVMRVLPVVNEKLNEEWLTDKARFNYDGYRSQRVVEPMVRVEGELVRVSWEEAFRYIIEKLYKKDLVLDGVIGETVDLRSAVLFKQLIERQGRGGLIRESDTEARNLDFRGNYVFGSGIEGVRETDCCIIIGANIRLEMPLLAVRLRRKERERNLFIATIGSTVEYYFKSYKIGNGANSLLEVLEGRHKVCRLLKEASKPMLIVGTHGMTLGNVNGIISGINSLRGKINLVGPTWNGVNWIHLSGNSVGLLDVGIGGARFGKGKALYMFGVNSVEVKKAGYELIIYQGAFGNKAAEVADVILPGSNHLEKDGLYMNVEGRVQKSVFMMRPPGNSRNDWRILAGLNEYLHLSNGSEKEELGKEQVVIEKNKVAQNNLYVGYAGVKNPLGGSVYNSHVHDYYRTDNVSRSSRVMGLCAVQLGKNKVNVK